MKINLSGVCFKDHFRGLLQLSNFFINPHYLDLVVK